MTGDLVWKPQGTYLMRKRNEGDNLFSNAEVTAKPVIGVFVGSTENKNYKKVMVGNTFYEIKEREIKFYVERRESTLAC